MKKLLFSFLLLTSCGWTPLYSEKSNPSLQNAQIFVEEIPGLYGAKMRRILQNNFPVLNNNSLSQYRLFVFTPSFSGGDKTITNDEFASMMQVTAKTSYHLKDVKTNKVISTGNVIAVSSYAVVRNPYATTVAKNHIQEELSEQLAHQVSLDVLEKFSEDTK